MIKLNINLFMNRDFQTRLKNLFKNKTLRDNFFYLKKNQSCLSKHVENYIILN
jgi:hypothetical protein